MPAEIEYTPKERFWLIALGAFGFLVLNTVFGYALVFQPESLVAAFTNPVALVFIVEAFLLLGVFSYLMRKWGVLQLRWGWFVFLALLGSMIFALPIVLLYPKRTPKEPN
jgi:hypothetical protein